MNALGAGLRSLLFPGLDLHTRNRGAMRRFWKTGPRDVLDAGSGNGYLAWLAYRSGASVVAMNRNAGEIERSRALLLGVRGADPQRLRFEQRNLYDLPSETRTFDEVICSEVLEHIRGDAAVARQFFRILRPGGYLHLCCPNRLHPRHQAEVLDEAESGGHVRAGYTEADYRALLEPIGFEIDRVTGIGPAGVYHADRMMRAVRHHVGDWAALPLVPFTFPFLWVARLDPPTPFSIYVRAVKPRPAR